MIKTKKVQKILLLFISTFLISCSETNENDTRTYSDYEEFSIATLDEFYTQKEDFYCVELYYETCQYCNQVKPYLFDYIDAFLNNAKTTKVYFFNMYKSSSNEGIINRSKFKTKPDSYNRDDIIAEMLESKPSTISDTYFISVPSVYVISNGSLSNYVIGSTEVINFYGSLT